MGGTKGVVKPSLLHLQKIMIDARKEMKQIGIDDWFGDIMKEVSRIKVYGSMQILSLSYL
jgi:hypothetical protein